MVKNFHTLTNAINYIENNLINDITQQMVADSCYISLSSLQKLFRYAMNLSVKEYISKRRITNAANDLLSSDMTIMDIAFKYQYNSHEVFTRAFTKVWNESPSSFRKHWKFSGLFPKFKYHYEKGMDIDMIRKKVDVSNMYEVIKNMSNTYVIGFDIKGMIAFNDIEYEVGDLALLETARRIDEEMTSDMVLIRIGADEFALLTGISDESAVTNLAEKILSKNCTCIEYKDKKIPLSLYAAFTKIPENDLSFRELFNNIHEDIAESKVN